MTKKDKALIIILLNIFIFSNPVFSQRFIGFSDDFEDGSLEFQFRNNQNNRPAFVIWDTKTPVSYQLIENNGILNIDYSSLNGIGAFDHFTFHPFRPMNIENNPRIQFDVKSDVSVKLAVSPAYSVEPPTVEYIEQEISGDNAWHTYTFNLTESYYKNKNISAVDFYIDRGTSEKKSAKIKMDNFKMAWYLIYVTNLQAQVNNGNNVKLNWETSDKEQTAGYKIYRGTSGNFTDDESSFLAESETNFYNDNNLDPYRHYFYKIVPVAKSGEVFFASKEVRVETYETGKTPQVAIRQVNSTSVKKYEKFELNLELKNVGIDNPFNPADIDVYANFTTPSGKTIKINAFYDNYLNADKWKIRFSPNETGAYKYQVFVQDEGGIGQTEMAGFEAIESEHHGWIKPAKNNPHYFQNDDGTSFYAIGVYSPWRNDLTRFETFARHNANLLAIWDITYGGFVNGTGLIEEELGRYNQLKLGRIDSMLTILEKDDIKLMYAIWPHDLFSETVWAAQWKQNPYSKLIDVEEVYSDSLVWEYQKQKYRYLIARFAHSRSWGIWELINEMNGTDGWAAGRYQECYDWVEKCDRYFKENDPYNHPTTASFSGGFTEYRTPLYERTDIPNIHMYPAQGWEMKYPADTMRSAMYNYAWASRRFRDRFEKPAIFGESGADLAYYHPKDENYHIAYHNQLWASLTNGLAGIPVWWDYPVLNEQDWMQIKTIAAFVADIDFANQPYKPADCKADGADIYTMDAGNNLFGWLRSFEKPDISGLPLEIAKPGNEKYIVSWFDAWSGNIIKTETVISKNGNLNLSVPKLQPEKPDIAFKITRK